MKTLDKIIAILMLLFSIGFNLWIYRAEPTTTIDPNDNAFQFALIERTNEIWDYTGRTCPKTMLYPFCYISHLTNHWVPNWAQGYNLPYYYSHVPQIMMVGSYRMLESIIKNSLSLFQYYHLNIYLLLSLFPLSLFLAFRILKFPWLTAGIAALLASQISTDGLYGIDQSSFLWRGWGLSSQLFALIWFPLAIASIIAWTKDHSRKSYFWSIIFLSFTTSGHLGIGMMTFLAIPVICVTPVILMIAEKQKYRHVIESLIVAVRQTVILAIPPILILSYWIVPAFLNNNFHNISVWDPVWKFNSYGAQEAISMFTNGSLFDFGRFPVMTILLLVGIFASMTNGYPMIGLLFITYLFLFFGRTTWGGLLNIIPGMSEFHQHRFIVGIHLAGLFLAPIGLTFLSEKITKTNVHKFITLLPITLVLTFATFWFVVPQTISYASYNTTLIQQANAKYQEEKNSFEELLGTLRELEKNNPGRVYALRGNEGKAFTVAGSTPYYMQLSTYGIPTVLWLPETWSMNSDTEQFFIEENQSHYSLYNIRYVVAPPTKKPQAFWNKLKETEKWVLYETKTEGYISVGTSPAVVTAQKTDIINLVHLWIQSDHPKKSLFPELRIAKQEIKNTSLPHFQMTDPVTYVTPDGYRHSLLNEPPVYENPKDFMLPMIVHSQTVDMDMKYAAKVEVTTSCPTCVVVLKQTYHPNWKTTVNGKSVKPIAVFPFYVAIRLESPGLYEILYSYASLIQFY